MMLFKIEDLSYHDGENTEEYYRKLADVLFSCKSFLEAFYDSEVKISL